MSPFRTPIAAVTVNGSTVAGLVEAEVVSTNRYAVDCFRADLALGVDPIATAAFWCDTPSLLLALSIGHGNGQLQELIRGYVDTVSFDFGCNRVRVEGRSLGAAFVDTRLAQTFPNRTSSEVAALLAANHNLGSSVTPTTTLIGRYYQNEHDAIALDGFSRTATEWDLLTSLARWEGFNVFVSGSTLFFNPPSGSPPARVIQPEEVISLHLKRSVTLSRDLSVTVKSWNSRQKAAVAETVQSSPTTQASASVPSLAPPPLDFVILHPNLTPAQAQQLAQRRLSELTPHERVIEVVLPGDVTLTPQDRIALSGTQTSFDQFYQVDAIVRTVGRGGFRQRIRAVGPTSQQSETGAGAV